VGSIGVKGTQKGQLKTITPRLPTAQKIMREQGAKKCAGLAPGQKDRERKKQTGCLRKRVNTNDWGT